MGRTYTLTHGSILAWGSGEGGDVIAELPDGARMVVGCVLREGNQWQSYKRIGDGVEATRTNYVLFDVRQTTMRLAAVALINAARADYEIRRRERDEEALRRASDSQLLAELRRRGWTV